MKFEPLLPAFAKIERAKTQIHQVNELIEHFRQPDNYESVCRIDPTGQEETYSFRLKQSVPGDLILLVGETLHNLRTPLDQMIAAVATKERGSAAGTCFPFGRHRNHFEAALAKQKKLLPADAIALIEEAKPYKGGNLLLWALHELNRADKHYDELVPVFINQGWRVGFLGIRKRDDGRENFALIGDPRGGYLTTGNHSPIPRGPSIPGEVEYLTVRPGSKFNINAQPTFDIAFGKIEGLEREPIVAVLYQMRDLVERILLTFRDRFFPQ